jgi:GNAT superfamily N-acetyltransferase
MPRTSVEVRRAVPGDVDLLLRLAQRILPEDVAPGRLESGGARQRLLTAIEREDVTVLLACAGQEPVGVLVLRLGELIPLCGSGAVHVEQVFVDPDWRRKGIARQLLSAAVTAAEHHDAADVVCTLPPGQRDAQRFLARLGFAPLVVQRAVPVGTLRRRLAGDLGGGRGRAAVELVLARRRREARKRPAVSSGAAAQQPG